MNIEKDVHIVNSNFKFDFSILHCGIETETANFQPTIFDRFVFNYVLEGRGEIVINDKAFPFAKGDVFIIPEKTLFYQVNSKEDPYKYLYLAIKGDVASVHERATLTAQNPVLHGAGERVREIMFQIFHELFQSILGIEHIAAVLPLGCAFVILGFHLGPHIGEGQGDALVQICQFPQTRGKSIVVIDSRDRKYLRVGMESDGSTRIGCLARHLYVPEGLAFGILLHEHLAFPVDLRTQIVGKRIHA